MIHCSAWASLVALCFSLASAPLQAASCTWVVDSLGAVEPTPYPPPPKTPKFAYYRWDNKCYGDKDQWVEWNDQNAWVNGVTSKLEQRLDFYRPDATAMQRRPLIVWAHPGGLKDDLLTDQLEYLLKPALLAGYAFASIEFRHPLSSFVSDASYEYCLANPPVDGRPCPPATGPAPVPNDDPATAVRYLRYKAAEFGIDADSIFLVGQSRGSLVLQNALRKIPAEPGVGGWRGQPGTVQGVMVYQAQTSYVEEEIATTFIKKFEGEGDTKEPRRDWFRQDFPDVPSQAGVPLAVVPGSSLKLAAQGSFIPLRMTYDGEVNVNPDDSVQLGCYKSYSLNPGHAPKTACPAGRFEFDVHNPNYGKALKTIYQEAGQSSQFMLCPGMGHDEPAVAYSGYVAFFDSIRGMGTKPDCPTAAAARDTPAR